MKKFKRTYLFSFLAFLSFLILSLSMGFSQEDKGKKDYEQNRHFLKFKESLLIYTNTSEILLSHQGPVADLSISGKKGYKDLSSQPFLVKKASEKIWIFNLQQGKLSPSSWRTIPPQYQVKIQTPQGTIDTNRESLVVIQVKDQSSISIFLGRGEILLTPRGTKSFTLSKKEGTLFLHLPRDKSIKIAKDGKKVVSLTSSSKTPKKEGKNQLSKRLLKVDKRLQLIQDGNDQGEDEEDEEGTPINLEIDPISNNYNGFAPPQNITVDSRNKAPGES